MRRIGCILLFLSGPLLFGQSIDLAVQKGHAGAITFIVFNSNGRLIASAGEDHLIKIWHVPTGKEMASMVSESSATVASLAFSTGDDWLMVEYEGGEVHAWEVSTSSRRPVPQERSSIQFTRQDRVFSPDSAFEYYTEGFYLRKKDRRTGGILFAKVPIDISQPFAAIASNETFQRVVGAGRDGKVYVYDSRSGKNLAIREDHYASVNSTCFSPDGRLFATASADRSIIIWDSQSLLPVKRLFSRAFRFESLSFDASGNKLAAGDELGKVRIIDLKSSRLGVSTYTWHRQKISNLGFSPDGAKVWSAGYDNRLVCFDLAAQKVTEEVSYRNYVSLGDAFLKMLGAHREPFAWINTVAISPSGQYVAAGGSWREAVVRRQPQPLIFREEGARVDKIKMHQGGIASAAFVNDHMLVTAFRNDLYQWYRDPGARKFFFRQHLAASDMDILQVTPFGKDTLILRTNRALLWYDLAQEKILTRDTASSITASSSMASRREIAFASGHDLVIRKGDNAFRIKEAHTDRITSMAISPTRPLLATASWDATIKFWSTESGKLLATLVAVGAEDHIIVTPDNFYFGTRNSLKGIGFKYGKQFISPEQFDLRFNRPDIVVERLGFAEPNVLKSYRRAYQKRLQKMNFTEEMLAGEIQLPELKVLNESVPLRTDKRELRFQLRATDSRYAIDRINVVINDVPVFGLAGVAVRHRKRRMLDEEVTLVLSPGRNRIQFSCLNERGTESLMETYEVEAMLPRKKPDLYLAVISVSTYDNAAKNLKYAVKDGRDLINLYAKRADAFQEVYVDTLFNEQATRENILTLKNRLMKSSVEDQVMLYVSGHGLLDDRLDFYFGTHDLDFDDPAERGMKYDELENLLDSIPARNKLLLMDACHSGEVDKGQLRVSDNQSLVLEKGQRGTLKKYNYAPDVVDESRQLGMKTAFELMQELFANLSKGSGSVVISAAAGNSYALESDEWKNGIFTYCLLAGLKTGRADLNRDGSITVTELKIFVGKEVERLTEGEQRPTSRRESLEFDFVVW